MNNLHKRGELDEEKRETDVSFDLINDHAYRMPKLETERTGFDADKLHEWRTCKESHLPDGGLFDVSSDRPRDQ